MGLLVKSNLSPPEPTASCRSGETAITGGLKPGVSLEGRNEIRHKRHGTNDFARNDGQALYALAAAIILTLGKR